MSKKSSSKMLVHQLSTVLPDDRPITAINIIEDIEKCPPNFTVVSRTYDQDTDADLWRETGLFIKKKGRYICFSKTEGLPHCIVEDITIINEREMPPEGYSIISHTIDSMQKAWRKKQLCYKIKNKDLCSKAVTDIIICSRIVHKASKMAPNGFAAAGIINGVCVCYKTVDITTNGQPNSQSSYINIDKFLTQNASPNPSNGTPHRVPPERPPKPKFSPKPNNGIYSQIGTTSIGKDTDESNDRDYEVLNPSARLRPTRPAPQPPTTSVIGSIPIYGTLPGSSDLDGVPFILNPRLNIHSDSASYKIPTIKIWTQKDLDKEFCYDFRAERET